jgi:hypothetical protein
MACSKCPGASTSSRPAKRTPAATAATPLRLVADSPAEEAAIRARYASYTINRTQITPTRALLVVAAAPV